jgi:Cu/Ag efflux protein CusF
LTLTGPVGWNRPASAEFFVSGTERLRRHAMKMHLILPTIIALSFGNAAYAQQALKGEIASVDEASGKIAIKLSDTVGAGGSTAPTQFKVQDGLVFNAVKPGDKVSFTAENVDGVMTIKTITRD